MKPDSPRDAGTARRARPRPSLKMQAIGFLSRREHSRQELRVKLLDSLRKRAREDAVVEAAAERAAKELAEALSAQPSNGIDDAFAPAAPLADASRARGGDAHRSCVVARSSLEAPSARGALETLTLANGAPLPLQLRTSLAASGVSTSAAAELPHAAVSDDDLEQDDPEAAVDQLLDWLAANNYLSEARFVESRVNARSRKQGTLRIKLELSRHGLALEPEQAAALRETEFSRARALWQRKFGALATDARQRAKQARFLASRGFAADVVRRIVGGEEEF